MYALKHLDNEYFYGYGPSGAYNSKLVSLAVKFNNRLEAEFVLQDLKSRSLYKIVEVT